MATKEITFPKKQNVTFYEKDKALYDKIVELAKRDGRGVQNYILQVLHQVIPLDEEPTSFSNSVSIPVQEVREVKEVESTINNINTENTRNKLMNLTNKSH